MGEGASGLPGRTEELQNFLCAKIKLGYAFPLNPKWILCDKGWKKVFNLMLESEDQCVQRAMNKWYLPDSGIRERIEDIHKRHPNGYVSKHTLSLSCNDAENEMHIARLKLKRHIIFNRAKHKLRNVLRMKNVKEKQKLTKIEKETGGMSKEVKG